MIRPFIKSLIMESIAFLAYFALKTNVKLPQGKTSTSVKKQSFKICN